MLRGRSMEVKMALELTGLERRCLEHLQLARSQGTGMAAYARAAGLKVRMLYDTKRRLAEKGVVIGGSNSQGCDMEAGGAPAAGSAFVPARIGAPASSSACAMPILRVHHAQGHVLEFGAWPPAAVIAALLTGGADAA
jgi:hypothetical protein